MPVLPVLARPALVAFHTLARSLVLVLTVQLVDPLFLLGQRLLVLALLLGQVLLLLLLGHARALATLSPGVLCKGPASDEQDGEQQYGPDGTHVERAKVHSSANKFRADERILPNDRCSSTPSFEPNFAS